jgi:hypothetical protein
MYNQNHNHNHQDFCNNEIDPKKSKFESYQLHMLFSRQLNNQPLEYYMKFYYKQNIQCSLLKHKCTNICLQRQMDKF